MICEKRSTIGKPSHRNGPQKPNYQSTNPTCTCTLAVTKQKPTITNSSITLISAGYVEQRHKFQPYLKIVSIVFSLKKCLLVANIVLMPPFPRLPRMYSQLRLCPTNMPPAVFIAFRSAFHNLWVATRRWVADSIQVGCRGLNDTIISIVSIAWLHLSGIKIASVIRHC